MKINYKDIDKALEYYKINDTGYQNKCYKCIEESLIQSMTLYLIPL